MSAEMVHTCLQPLLPAHWAMATQLSEAVVHSWRVCCLSDDAAVSVSPVSSCLQHAATGTSGTASADTCGNSFSFLDFSSCLGNSIVFDCTKLLFKYITFLVRRKSVLVLYFFTETVVRSLTL